MSAVLVVAAFGTASAGAKVVTDTLTNKHFGVLPSANAAPPAITATGCNAENSDCTKLTYAGGPVQHAENVYLFFWAPTGHTVSSSYVSGLSTWLTGVTASDYTSGNQLSVDQQYYDNSGPAGAHNFVPYAVTNGGTVTDTAAYPASGCPLSGYSVCLTDAQLASQLTSYLNAHPTLPKGLGAEYFIMTPTGVRSCFDSAGSSCSYTSYCGYHSYTGSGATQILYADMPWSYMVNGCDVNIAFGAGYPNGSSGIDPIVGIFSHELSETMTDPNPGTGWTQTGGKDAGYEVGDKCAYIYGSGGYGSMSGLSNNGLGYWNIALGSHDYLMQLEFDNRVANCALKDTDIQPAETVTVTPNPPTHGSSATFKASITDSLGVAYVRWSFGDGSIATTQGTSCTGTSPVVCSTTHIYAAAHTTAITASAIVTDKHGNEKRVPLTFTVK